MKRTLPVYYTPNLEKPQHHSRGELTFTTLSVADHAMLEGQETRIHEALTSAGNAFRASMGRSYVMPTVSEAMEDLDKACQRMVGDEE